MLETLQLFLYLPKTQMASQTILEQLSLQQFEQFVCLESFFKSMNNKVSRLFIMRHCVDQGKLARANGGTFSFVNNERTKRK